MYFRTSHTVKAIKLKAAPANKKPNRRTLSFGSIVGSITSVKLRTAASMNVTTAALEMRIIDFIEVDISWTASTIYLYQGRLRFDLIPTRHYVDHSDSLAHRDLCIRTSIDLEIHSEDPNNPIQYFQIFVSANQSSNPLDFYHNRQVTR